MSGHGADPGPVQLYLVGRCQGRGRGHGLLENVPNAHSLLRCPMRFLCILLLALALHGTCLARPPATPMTFSLESNGGNCIGCEWISARGVINEGTAARFAKFYREEKRQGCYLLALDSSGGSVIEAIKLGELIRQYGCTTTIARSINDMPGYATGFTLQHDGECYSACAYAFLGGKTRWVDAKAKYGVHQHYDLKSLAAPLAKTLSAADVSGSQLLTGLLVAYAMQMDVDPLLITVASLVPPSAPMHVLTGDELAHFRVVTNVAPPAEPWRLEPRAQGLVARVRQPQTEAPPQEFWFYCRATNAEPVYLEISRAVDSAFVDQLRKAVQHPPRPIDLYYSRDESLSIRPLSYRFTSNADGSQMTILLPLSKEAYTLLATSKTARWDINLSSASQSLVGGLLSTNQFGSLVPFALANCVQ